MRTSLRVILFALMLTIVLNYTTDAQDLDNTLEPEFGTSAMDYRSWQERITSGGHDYFSHPIRSLVGRLLFTLSPNCLGYVNAQPTHLLDWKRVRITEDIAIRLFFIAREDTVLVVQEPNGNWLCNDDSFQSNRPTIDVLQPRSGRYAIWVGSGSQQPINGELFITPTFAYTPRDYPLVPASDFGVIGRAAAYADSELIFVDYSIGNNEVRVSVDMILMDMLGGELVRVGIWPRSDTTNDRVVAQPGSAFADSDGYVYTAHELRALYGDTLYDFSASGPDPIGLSLPLNELPANEGYHLDVRIQIQLAGRWQDLDIYSAYNLPPLGFST